MEMETVITVYEIYENPQVFELYPLYQQFPNCAPPSTAHDLNNILKCKEFFFSKIPY